MPDHPSMTDDRRHSHPRRRRGFTLGAILAIALVLVAGAWAALQAEFPPERVQALARTQLEKTVNREVRFQRASISLFPPVRIAVEQPALAEPGGFKQGTALKATSLNLDLNPFALLQRRLVVRRLEVVDPVAHYVMHADGSTNMDSLTKSAPAQGGAPMDLAVQEFVLKNAQILLDDQKSHRRTMVTLDTKLQFASTGGTRISTSGTTQISGLAFGPDTVTTASRLDHSLQNLAWTVDHKGEMDLPSRRLTLDRIDLTMGKTHVGLSGVVDEPGPRARLDLRARGQNVALADVLDFLAAADAGALHGIKGSGQATFDLAIRGALGAAQLPGIEGTLAVRNGTFRYPAARVPVEGVNFEARFAPDSVTIPNLSARVAGQPLRADLAAVHFADPQVRFGVRGNNLDLGAVAPLVAPRDTKVGGHVNLDVRGSGSARDPGSMALAGTAKLANVSLQSPQLAKPVHDVNGTLAFTPGRATIQKLTAHAGQSSFTLDGTVTRPLALMAKPGSVGSAPAGVEFNLTSPYLDVAELIPPVPGGRSMNARGTGTVSIGRLRNQKLDVRNVVAQVVVEPNKLTVPHFTLDGYGGKVTGSAALGLANLQNPSYSIKGHAQDIHTDEFLQAWTAAGRFLTGTASSDFSVSGDGTTPDAIKRTLTALGFAALVNGRIAGPVVDEIAKVTGMSDLQDLQFKDFKLPFRVEQGRVVTDSLHLVSRLGDWRGAGAVGFDGTLDYAIAAALPKEVAARLGNAQGVLAQALGDNAGNVVVPLRITGHAKSPSVQIDQNALRNQLAGRAQNMIQKELLGKIPHGTTNDSAGQANAPDLQKDLKNQANDLLNGLFGKHRGAKADTTRKDSIKR